MKTRIKTTLVLFAVISILFSCQTESADIKTGIIAKVYFGRGDCMPVIDSRRVYNLYSGRLYIIKKQEYDKSDNTLEYLKNTSMKRIVKNGELALSLKPDSFVVIIDNVSESNNAIYIKENDVIKTPFYFFSCTSY